jgi:hypothetical protein
MKNRFHQFATINLEKLPYWGTLYILFMTHLFTFVG